MSGISLKLLQAASNAGEKIEYQVAQLSHPVDDVRVNAIEPVGDKVYVLGRKFGSANTEQGYGILRLPLDLSTIEDSYIQGHYPGENGINRDVRQIVFDRTLEKAFLFGENTSLSFSNFLRKMDLATLSVDFENTFETINFENREVRSVLLSNGNPVFPWDGSQENFGVFDKSNFDVLFSKKIAVPGFARNHVVATDSSNNLYVACHDSNNSDKAYIAKVSADTPSSPDYVKQITGTALKPNDMAYHGGYLYITFVDARDSSDNRFSGFLRLDAATGDILSVRSITVSGVRIDGAGLYVQANDDGVFFAIEHASDVYVAKTTSLTDLSLDWSGEITAVSGKIFQILPCQIDDNHLYVAMTDNSGALTRGAFAKVPLDGSLIPSTSSVGIGGETITQATSTASFSDVTVGAKSSFSDNGDLNEFSFTFTDLV
jgi:hypothetical protein